MKTREKAKKAMSAYLQSSESLKLKINTLLIELKKIKS